MSETLYIPSSLREQLAILPSFEYLKIDTVNFRKRVANLLEEAGFSYSGITAITKTPRKLDEKIRRLQGRGITAPICDIHSVTVEAPGPYTTIIRQVQAGFPGSPCYKFPFGTRSVQDYSLTDPSTSSMGLWVAFRYGARIGEIKFTPDRTLR